MQRMEERDEEETLREISLSLPNAKADMGLVCAGKLLQAGESELDFGNGQTCPAALGRGPGSLHLHELCLDFAICGLKFQLLWRAGGGGEDWAKCSKNLDIVYSE